LLSVLLLVFQDGLGNGFRFGKQDDNLIVYLIGNQAVKRAGFFDPLDDGADKGKA
jgi:hypothetical protein